ncbi:MAG: hypothetical protein M1813_002122 [Trichoglossum hirsutum]|nr:MAG: hypothetical protein M1813_002122 [Trichoglossum hirsutum]
MPASVPPNVETLMCGIHVDLKIHPEPNELDISQSLSKRERDALSAALEQLEFISIKFRHIPSNKSLPPLAPFTGLGDGEELTDEDFEHMPHEFQLPCLFRKNLKCLSLANSITTTRWPEDDFGTIWPRLSTIIIQNCNFDAYGLALLARAHRNTLRCLSVMCVVSQRRGFPWLKFCEMIQGVVPLEVLEMDYVSYWPETRKRTDTVRTIYDGKTKLGTEIRRILGRHGEIRRSVELGILVKECENWFIESYEVAAWDPFKAILSLV